MKDRKPKLSARVALRGMGLVILTIASLLVVLECCIIVVRVVMGS